MTWKLFLLIFGSIALLAARAHALTQTSDYPVPYEVVIVAGQGDANVETYHVDVGETMIGICQQNRVIPLPDGLSWTFEGQDDVFIVDGEFALAE